MDEVDKGCLVIRLGVGGCIFLLVTAPPGQWRTKGH